MPENQITIKNLSKVYDNGFNALKNINLEVKKGEILARISPFLTSRLMFLRALKPLS